jgi:dTDP-4-amino-4,6-dideoxygalactose transaminase
MADMDAILDLADQYGLAVVEDACQAHGSSYFSKRRGGWVRAGSVGRAAAFSFYPGKNLGACGEGGAVTTNDSAVAGKIKMLRDHGQVKKYFHDVEGYNGRLDAIQAGILHVKLAHLERWNSLRQECAARYGLLLAADDSVVVPYEPRWSKSVYHLYVIRIADRDGLMSHLRERGIATALHYPVPLHLQRAYVSLGYRAGDFAVSERIASEIVSLPMYPQLTAAQQGRIASEIGAFSARVGCQGVDRVWDAAAQAQVRG